MSPRKSAKRKVGRHAFMHTLDGKPAGFERGEQICFANYGRWDRRGVRLVATTAQIRAEQRITVAWRLAQGFLADPTRYGFVRVNLEPAFPKQRSSKARRPRTPTKKRNA